MKSLLLLLACPAAVIGLRRVRRRFSPRAVLPAPPAEKPSAPPLSELPELILKLLALSGKTTLTVPFLAERLRVNEIRFNAAVRELEGTGLVRHNPSSFSTMGPPTLSLTAKGQAFVIENNWDR